MKNIYEIYIPRYLFDSADSTNGFAGLSEKISRALLINKLGIKDESLLRRGNDKKKEPDYVYQNIGYEVTFSLSDTLIRQLKGLIPLTNAIEFTEENVIKQIEKALEKKSKKMYSLSTVPVILSLIPNIYWDTNVNAKEANCLDDIVDSVFANIWHNRQENRNRLFVCLYEQYISSGIFNDIYIVSFTIDKRYILYSILDFINHNKFVTYFGIRDNPILPYCRLISVERGKYFEPIQNFYKIKLVDMNRTPHNGLKRRKTE